MKKTMKQIAINLYYIGHKAEKLQELFEEYTPEPNENGYYLKFENYSELVVNQGVVCYTNCFKNEKEFTEKLYSKLLFNL